MINKNLRRLNALRRLLQTVAFCLVIAALQYIFRPERSFEVPLLYSLAIGLSTWALVESGSLLLSRPASHDWPQGWRGPLLVLVSIGLGFEWGTFWADRWFGWSSWDVTKPFDQRLSWLISLVAGGIISFYFYTRSKESMLQMRVQTAQHQASQSQLMLLQSQLEPHMLFNTLANLRALIHSDPPRAQAMLDHLIAYLRATLGASRQTLHPLHQEFERLRDYLEIMTVRMGPRLRYTLDLPDALAQLTVPTLLLQPLVENALLHGLEPSVQGGSLQISASRIGHELVLEVNDTGCGLTDDRLHTGLNSSAGGFGLTQVRERLLSHYGPLATFELQARQPAGTRARITLPLNDQALP